MVAAKFRCLFLQAAWGEPERSLGGAWEEPSTPTTNTSSSLPAHESTDAPSIVIQTEKGQDSSQAAQMLKAREEEEILKFANIIFTGPAENVKRLLLWHI